MCRLLSLLLLSTFAFSQAAPPAAKKPEPAAAPAKAEVAPTAAVITITGFCNGKVPATPSPDCKTTISRAEFEKLVDALDPKMPPARRQQLADAYSRMLVMSEIAQQRGLADTEEGKEILQFKRMETLMQLLGRSLQREASNVPAAETEKYYNEHAQQFEQAALRRIFIPKTPPGGEKPPAEKTLEAEGSKIHAAAVAPGADFEKLQKQAYEDLGIKTPPPQTDAGMLRRESLPPTQAKVFDLQPGQISEVINDAGGLYIFKVESKKKLTLAEVTPEINRTLESERMRAEVEKLTNLVKPEFNPEYFGSGAAPAGMPGERPAAPGPPRRPPAKPPASKPPAN